MSATGSVEATQSIAGLRQIMEEANKNAHKQMKGIRELIKVMLAALRKQPNINNDFKQGLPKLQVIVEHFEAARQGECESRRVLTSFVASPAASSGKREASASTLTPTDFSRTTKKKKKEGEAMRSASNEWTVVQKRQKVAKKKTLKQKAQEPKKNNKKLALDKCNRAQAS